MEKFLQIDNIKMLYETPETETLAVQDVSFSAKKGEFVSIVGPSGCGKSTLLSCIAGIKEQAGGTVTLGGEIIKGISPHIGYMLQNDNLLPWRSIYKNVVLGLEIQNKLTEENRDYAISLLKKYDLWDFKDSYPPRLSGGMRQRVALIRTLALKPELLLLDEAFSALDYQTRVKVSCDVYGILKKENKTLVMVTHDIPEAVAMSDKVIILSKRPGRVKKEVEIKFSAPVRDPVTVRTDPLFQSYFNLIWKELSD
ncbi:MAG: ABC transporter ATP-binding protein [Oscillospiraceae bacterium]